MLNDFHAWHAKKLKIFKKMSCQCHVTNYAESKGIGVNCEESLFYKDQIQKK